MNRFFTCPTFILFILCLAVDGIPEFYSRALEADPTNAPTFTEAIMMSWELHNDGDPVGNTISFDEVQVIIPFNATNRVFGSNVFTSDCTSAFEGGASSAFNVTLSQPRSLGGGFIEFNITIGMEISKINETEYWTESNETLGGGSVDICVETYIALPLDDVEMMNFIHNEIGISVEMDANFDVSEISVVQKEIEAKELAVDYSQYVEAYQCDPDYPDTPLPEELIPNYTQGDVLTLCIRGTESGVVEVTGVLSLTISQEGTDNFLYIDDGEPTNIEIVSQICDQGTTDVCVCEMRLLGRFFSSNVLQPLFVTGDVILEFSSSRRILKDSSPTTMHDTETLIIGNRHMEEEPKSGGFDLKVKVERSGDSSSSRLSEGMSTAFAALMMALLFCSEYYTPTFVSH
jgi:hypothetical protein